MSDIEGLLQTAFVFFLFSWIGFMWGYALNDTLTYKTIEVCQAELPRNETCELVAIKKESK